MMLELLESAIRSCYATRPKANASSRRLITEPADTAAYYIGE